jgi:uncharacterized protein YdaU (DUF1376 family)
VNFYAFHIGDYAGATRHLSWDEDMAYRRMLDVYYTREAPLPADRKQLYRLVGAAEKRQREAVDAVLAEFFYESIGGWSNARCNEEIEAMNAKRDKAAASARARWGAVREQADPHSDGNATAMRTHSEGNAPNPNPNPNPMKEDGMIARATFEETEAAIRGVPELAGQPVTITPVIAPIWNLVQRGFDLNTQILPSIRRQAANARRPIKAWAYFIDGIVQDATPQPIEPTGARSYGSSRRPSGAQQIRDAIADVKAAVADGDPAP